MFDVADYTIKMEVHDDPDQPGEALSLTACGQDVNTLSGPGESSVKANMLWCIISYFLEHLFLLSYLPACVLYSQYLITFVCVTCYQCSILLCILLYTK